MHGLKPPDLPTASTTGPWTHWIVWNKVQVASSSYYANSNMHRSSDYHSFPENSGMCDIQMTRAGDAMDLFNQFCTNTKTRTIIKYQIKIECLSNLEVQQCRQTWHSYRSQNEGNLLDTPIKENETDKLYKYIFVNNMLSQEQLFSNDLLFLR